MENIIELHNNQYKTGFSLTLIVRPKKPYITVPKKKEKKKKRNKSIALHSIEVDNEPGLKTKMMIKNGIFLENETK